MLESVRTHRGFIFTAHASFYEQLLVHRTQMSSSGNEGFFRVRNTTDVLFLKVAGEITPRFLYKANTSSASQEISWILWKRTVYYHVRNNTPPVPILLDINPYPANVENMTSS